MTDMEEKLTLKYNSSVSLPQYDWGVQIGSLHVHIVKGTEPNAFHRWMQWLMLGFKWERLK